MIFFYKNLYKSFNMGISCNGYNLNNFRQIYFKLGGDVPWVDLYQVCSNGHALLIFGFFMNFFVHFWGANLENSSPLKQLTQLL